MITICVETRICSNPNCPHLGNPIPVSRFNRNRRTCQDCDRKRAREYARIRRENLWAERKPIIDKWLGTKCVVCAETGYDLLRCHEQFGIEHKPLLETPIEEVESNCVERRFVRVCERCHRKAHSLMNKGFFSWTEISSIIKEFLTTNPPMTQKKHTCIWRSWLKKRLK